MDKFTDPVVAHHFGGDVYAKEMRVPAGQYIVSHQHKYDHLSILAKGSVLLEVDGKESRHWAPACIQIAAGQHHKITALRDVVWFCIHSTSIRDPDKVDDALIDAPDLAAVVKLVTGDQ